MTDKLRAAAQAALEALEHHVAQTRPIQKTSDAIDTLRAALAEPELQWALWHDGDLLIRRGEVNLVLTPNERKSIVDWLQKVAA